MAHPTPHCLTVPYISGRTVKEEIVKRKGKRVKKNGGKKGGRGIFFFQMRPRTSIYEGNLGTGVGSDDARRSSESWRSVPPSCPRNLGKKRLPTKPQLPPPAFGIRRPTS